MNPGLAALFFIFILITLLFLGSVWLDIMSHSWSRGRRGPVGKFIDVAMLIAILAFIVGLAFAIGYYGLQWIGGWA